ncbi:amidophosphoribosyltransferase [Christensenellaceae bacterium OttesenSCG-928-L17]|nr:amidophosphoribosyltransferase [Christensenellaceae bacterium OttesenSCG-928-L17]
MTNMHDKLHEECGVFGIYLPSTQDVATYAYYALYALQHRGQESCGIAVNDDGLINSYRDAGLVNDVFNERVLKSLGTGQMAVGHVRYGTSGHTPRLNAQPLVVNHIKGRMALAHNGNLTNDAELREELELSGSIFHTTSDSEVIAYVITKERLSAPSVEEAISRAMDKLKGAYSLVVMSPSKLIAARDPFGFHPLCIGEKDGGFVFASESCALDSIGATFLRDIQPGEIVIADQQGLRSITTHCNTEKTAMCAFEFIYFSRPDSVIDGSSVHIARQRAGAFLALEHPVQADVVIGVPDSGIDSALGYARQSGIPYGIGFIKNKYVARTFIEPSQARRESKVRIKLNPISATIEGKRVVLIDDSLVRGTTCARIVRLLREAGATEVHMRSSAPKFLYPCYFGTDIGSQKNLFAYLHDDDEMKRLLDVDTLGFLSVENVHKLADRTELGFCAACFSGEYPCETPKMRSRNKFSQRISLNRQEEIAHE